MTKLGPENYARPLKKTFQRGFTIIIMGPSDTVGAAPLGLILVQLMNQLFYALTSFFVRKVTKLQ